MVNSQQRSKEKIHSHEKITIRNEKDQTNLE